MSHTGRFVRRTIPHKTHNCLRLAQVLNASATYSDGGAILSTCTIEEVVHGSCNECRSSRKLLITPVFYPLASRPVCLNALPSRCRAELGLASRISRLFQLTRYIYRGGLDWLQTTTRCFSPQFQRNERGILHNRQLCTRADKGVRSNVPPSSLPRKT